MSKRHTDGIPAANSHEAKRQRREERRAADLTHGPRTLEARVSAPELEAMAERVNEGALSSLFNSFSSAIEDQLGQRMDEQMNAGGVFNHGSITGRTASVRNPIAHAIPRAALDSARFDDISITSFIDALEEAAPRISSTPPVTAPVAGLRTLELGDTVRVGEISEPIPIYAGTGSNRRLVGHWHPVNPGADEDPYEHTELSQRGLDLDDAKG